jgi:hypothetical protein
LNELTYIGDQKSVVQKTHPIPCQEICSLDVDVENEKAVPVIVTPSCDFHESCKLQGASYIARGKSLSILDSAPIVTYVLECYCRIFNPTSQMAVPPPKTPMTTSKMILDGC